MQKWDWLRLIHRLAISNEVKNVAGALALFALADGSRVVTTDPKARDGLGLSERTMRGHVAVLRGLKLLHVVQAGGGRGLTDTFQVCQMTEPAEGGLPLRLDDKFRPLEERPKGTAPLKAIAASKAARAADKERQAASAVSRLSARNTGSAAAAESAHDTGNSGSPAAGESSPQPTNTGSPATGDSPAAPSNAGSEAAGESADPETNPGSPAADESPGADGIHRQAASGESGKHRQGASETPAGGFRNTGSPAATTVVKPKNPTPRMAWLGGDLTSDAGTDDEDPDLSASEPTTGQSAVEAAAFQPTDDPEYDEARAVVAAVPLEELAVLLSDAQSELEAEFAAAAGVEDDGKITFGGGREILMRAAEIVRRGETYGGPQ
jgi:hypothetical protein